MMTNDRIQDELFAMRDETYKAFHEKLIPTVPAERVIGVRTPALRKYAAVFAKTADAADFMTQLPHTYYEENNLHAFLIEKLGDFQKTVDALEVFLPFVDNWATCDMMNPKVLGEKQEKLLSVIPRWLESGHIYMIRFAVLSLMRWFLDGNFRDEYLEWVAAVSHEDYYVRMVQAWFFAETLVKQYDAAIVYLKEKRFSPWIHNKIISKACDSFRMDKETKTYLRSLRIKNDHKI